MMKTREERRAERDEAIAKRRTGRPTPTQEEADLAALGVPHGERGHADSGAGPDPVVEGNKERMREMRPERDPRGDYKTR